MVQHILKQNRFFFKFFKIKFFKISIIIFFIVENENENEKYLKDENEKNILINAVKLQYDVLMPLINML